MNLCMLILYSLMLSNNAFFVGYVTSSIYSYGMQSPVNYWHRVGATVSERDYCNINIHTNMPQFWETIMEMLVWYLLFQHGLLTTAIAYRLYSTFDRLTGNTYDCIYAYQGSTFFDNPFHKNNDLPLPPREHIYPFCLVTEYSDVIDQLCYLHNHKVWSFGELRQKHVHANDLFSWHAPISTIDEYERFLRTVDDDLINFKFCNCTGERHFGLQCQYSFDLGNRPFEDLLERHFANLPTIKLNEAVAMNDADVTCYRRDALCAGECLDWRQICNEIVDCIDGHDEINCELLEFNECGDEEYRCRSGHCIPLTFAFDMTPDCADASDEQTKSVLENARLSTCYRTVPNMFCDDHNNAWMMFPCGDGHSIATPLIQCENQRHIRTLKSYYAGNNAQCWQYFICAQNFAFLFPSLVNCTELCGTTGDCWPLLPFVCPNDTIIFPPNPIMLHPFVYFLYWANGNEKRSLPAFICYTHCDHIYPPSSSRYGYSCRAFSEFQQEPFTVSTMLNQVFDAILRLFSGCITKTNTNSAAWTFQCPITNHTISPYRVLDGYSDCYQNLDEEIDRTNCSRTFKQKFRCWTTPDQCISRRLLQDTVHHCSDSSDEVYPLECTDGTERACNHVRDQYQPTIIYYQFQVLINFIVISQIVIEKTSQWKQLTADVSSAELLSISKIRLETIFE